MEKLPKDCCTKGIFTLNDVIYDQIDGLSMDHV